MKTLFLLLFCLIITNSVFAQKNTLIFQKKIIFENDILLSDVDYYGRIYVCDTKGVIKRLDSLGNIEFVFSPSSSIIPTNFTAQNPHQFFVFYQELQEWVVLNRFLTEIERYKISEKVESNQYGEIGFVRLIVPSPNNTLWFFDESDFSLKNYDMMNKQILSQTPLGLILKDEEYPITYLQFYQGQVFLGVKGQGILVFDNFGSYKATLEYPNWTSIFFDEEFILITEKKEINKIIRKGLYNKEIKEIALPVYNSNKRETIHFVLYSNQKYYCLIKNILYIYNSK